MMNRTVSTRLIAAFTCLLIVAGAASVRAEESATLTIADAPPPEQLAKSIQAALQPQVLQLTAGDKPFFEFWLRKEIALTKMPPSEDVSAEALAEGTVLGALKVYEERYDFRDEEIPPGVYVLRLGIQPEDGDHLGSAPTRTFALLLPADKDTKLETSSHDDLMDASSTINAAEHPSNLNLQPVRNAPETFPSLGEHRRGHKVLFIRIPAKVHGQDKAFTVTFAVVYEGAGEI